MSKKNMHNMGTGAPSLDNARKVENPSSFASSSPDYVLMTSEQLDEYMKTTPSHLDLDKEAADLPEICHICHNKRYPYSSATRELELVPTKISVSLLKASALYCRTCQFLEEASKVDYKDPISEIEIKEDHITGAPLIRVNWKDGDCITYQLHCYIRGYPPNETFDDIRVRGFRLPFRRDIPHSPSISYYADKIKEWIKLCQHHNCTLPLHGEVTPRRPKRVLEVGTMSDPTLKLVDFTSSKSQYIALSYCWGPVRPQITLTKQQLSPYKTQIPFDELPQSLKDAVLLTRALNIQFLWIDSLCIIQDDGPDWVEESNKMKDVYSEATLVISADRAESCQEGFLPNRFEYGRIVDIPIKYNQFIKAFLSPISALFLESERKIIQRIRNDSSLALHKHFAPHATESVRMARIICRSNPTMDRAWCLQESLLASRIVHFTQSEMIWECLEDVLCECGTFENMKATKMGFPRKLQWNQMRHSSELPNVLKAWWSCVQQYNIRSLTRYTDKLPAISGLAQQMPMELLGKYYAGIWESELPQGLLWETLGEEYDSTIAMRAESYVGPSWSWVSINETGINRGFDMKPFARVLDIKCELATSSQFGTIKSASLTLDTTSFKVCCIGQGGDVHTRGLDKSELDSVQTPSRDDIPFTFLAYGDVYQKGKIMFGHILSNKDSKDRVVGRIRPGGKLQDVHGEYNDEEFQAMDLRCVLVGRDISDYGNEIYGCLLVKPSKREEGAFERVGTLRISFDKAWDLPGVGRSTIILV